MKALQRHAPSALRRDLASSSSSPTSPTTTKHRLGQTPLRAPRRGSIALPARAAAEGNKDPDPGWAQLASKATALALAAAMSMSPVAEVFASTTTTTLTPPPTSTSTSTSAATTTNGLPRSLVVTSTIDYERVARARSAMERRKKRQEEGGSGVSQAAATSTGSPTSTATTQQQRRDSNASELPSPDEADALLQFDRDAYTDDAWEAMKTIRAYASYVDSLADLEASPGCELCAANRRALERVWQTVSQEYYPPPGRAFSQAAWAARLPAALRASGGALRDAATARAAARDLVASLGDRYTEYLGPEAYRAALRRPLAGELAYAAARAAGGVGIVIEGPSSASSADGGGSRSSFGGGLFASRKTNKTANGARVAAVLAESSAEAAGVEPGDVLLEVEGYAAARLSVDELGALLRGPAGSAARVVVLKQPPSSPSPRLGATSSLSRPLLPSRAALSSSSSPRSSSSSLPLLPMVPVRAATNVLPSPRPAPLPQQRTSPPTPLLLTLDLERRPIPQPPVKTAPLSSPKGRSVAYIRLHYFARDATRALAGALLGAEARGDEGILLDLRNNPGGVFEEALADAAMFLRRGAPIASTTRTPSSVPQASSSRPPPPPAAPMATFVAGDLDGEASPTFLRRAALSSAPMAVLVDAGSASGAEVLAGALADNGRAALVGPRRTFGKGLIQYYFLVDDRRTGGSGDGSERKKNSSNDSGVGGGIKVTVAGYSTPNGHDPSAERGLEPQRWCSGHGSGPPGSSSWASTAASAAALEDGCLLEALRAVDDEIDRAGGADAAAALARF